MELRAANLFRRALATLFTIAAIGACQGRAAAGPFSQLIVFGDSLSDVGNIAQVSFGIYPGPYYYNDRFSNGPVFVEALSIGLDLGPSVRSTAGGNNFAYGGARTSGTGGFEGLFIRDIDEQVDQFLATRTADANALFVTFAGSNDLIGGQTNVNIPVGNMADDIGRLFAAGARNFLVPNLPLLGHTPRYNDNPNTLEEFNTRTAQFNGALSTMLDNLAAANAALNVFRLDVAALFSQAIADPAAFGLANVSDAAAPGLQPGASSYDTGRIAANAHEYVFWDELHPTGTVHAILARRALELFVLPGDYNSDQVVDAADYLVWRDTLGQTGTGLAADGNGNNEIDPGDYDVWRANFGKAASGANVGATGFASADVPEPGTWLGFVVAFAALLSAKRWAVLCR